MKIVLHPWVGYVQRTGVRAFVCTLLFGSALLLAACGQLQTAADSTATAAASETTTATPAASETGTPLAPVTGTPVATVLPTTLGPQFPGGLFGDGVVGSPVATTDWVTHENEKYGFSFEYPADWQIDESEATPEQVGPHGEPAYPRYSVGVQNPENEQGSKIPGVNCTHEPETCIGANPRLLAFRVSVFRPAGCEFTGALSADVITLGGQMANRCVSEFPNDKSRVVSLSFARSDGDVIRVQITKGNAVAANEQAVLETVLGTFRLAVPPPVPTP